MVTHGAWTAEGETLNEAVYTCGDMRVIIMLYTKYQQCHLGLGPKDPY